MNRPDRHPTDWLMVVIGLLFMLGFFGGLLG
jgi:hypothetical protein